MTIVAANTATGGVDTNALPPSTLSTADAYSIILTVNRTLDTDNPAAVKALRRKKPLFQASGQNGVVAAGLRLSLSEHLYFSKAVLERTSANAVADAKIVVDTITNALKDGIHTFSPQSI